MEMDARRRWLAVGHSSDPEPRQAGREAAGRALQGPDPALLIVFCSGLDEPSAVLAGINEVFPGVPLIGCSSARLITPDGLGGHGVVVTVLGGPGFTVRTEVGLGAGGAERAAGVAVAGCVAGLASDAPQRALLLLTDGWLAGQEEVIAGAYSVVGASLPMVGGSSSPDPAVGRPFQLHGRQVFTEAVVGAVIASDGPLAVGLRHGWRKVGEAMIVTHSVKGDVHTLDDQPALPTYLQRLGAPWQAYSDPQTFEIFARSRPIGIRGRGGAEIRSVSSSAGLRAGWLRSTGEVPEGGLVWLMEGDGDTILAAASDACREAVAGLGSVPPLGLLAFDCVSGSDMLGEEGTRQEMSQMIKEAGDAPVAGVYTWGEIARTRGINGYHNQTLAVLAVG
jgi:hypothetical protein